MADDSPGKVQTLRAIFAEKDKPLMGMMPPGGKIVANKPRKFSVDSSEETAPFRERSMSDQKISSQLLAKVLQIPVKKSELISSTQGEPHKDTNGFNEKTVSNKCSVPKPSIGPKPTYLTQLRTNSPVNGHLESSNSSDPSKNIDTRPVIDSHSLSISQAKSKAVADTIASFMFTNGLGHKASESVPSDTNNKVNNTRVPPPALPKNTQVRSSPTDKTNILNMCNSKNGELLSKCEPETICRNIINFDNYICKSNCNFKRKELPPLEKLGPAPLKPMKPPHMKLPERHKTSQSPPVPAKPAQTTSPPIVPLRPAPQRPSYPCPPRPHTPPPLPPVKPKLSLREEIEELYEDTLLGESKRPVSLIPEFTEEEEAEELYNDAGPVEDFQTVSLSLLPIKPKDPPPPCPSEYLAPNVHNSSEELYQDAEDPNIEEFYEEMPCEELFNEESGGPLYSNNKKEIEKLRREEEKKQRREQKEKEKREKEMEKLKKRFNLTGDEIPIDDGLVKMDSRGGKGDLPVRRGETVLILRMEGNPSGRWLVKNEKGKIGYVELTNIEVDPLSVKSVMTIRRLSVISASEELYCEARSEEEAIYEVTY